MLAVSAGAPPGDAETDLIKRVAVDQSLRDKLAGEHHLPDIEHLELGLDAAVANDGGGTPQMIRRVDLDVIAVAEVHRPAVEAADLGQKIHHMLNPFLRRSEIRPRRRCVQVVVIDDPGSAHPRRQIDDDVGVAVAESIDYLAKQGGVARALAGGGVPDVAMRHRRPRFGRINGGGRDLRRGHRDGGMLSDSVAGARHRTGKNDLEVHAPSPDVLFSTPHYTMVGRSLCNRAVVTAGRDGATGKARRHRRKSTALDGRGFERYRLRQSARRLEGVRGTAPSSERRGVA